LTNSSLSDRALGAARVDFAPRHTQPSWLRWVVATIVAIVGSLAVDAILVAIGKGVFPSTKNYAHFHVSDYAKLTIVGVYAACVAWPVVTRISSSPRWLFSRLAVLVTLVLLVPDVWLLHLHQPVRAVAVLMVMHLAIAVVSYFALVTVAPTTSLRHNRL
jgi:hypothetical protein